MPLFGSGTLEHPFVPGVQFRGGWGCCVADPLPPPLFLSVPVSNRGGARTLPRNSAQNPRL